jgi:hypothetical protein
MESNHELLPEINLNRPHGVGKLLESGNVYEGELVNGVPEGKGVQTMKQGHVYEGVYWECVGNKIKANS